MVETVDAPLCSICLENEDILCGGCQKKLDEDKINHTEVELSRTLYRLKDRFKSIEAGGFKRAEDLGSMILVVVPEGGAGKIIGRGGVIIQELEDALGKRVKVIEDGSLEEVTRELLGEGRLVGINKVFGRDGERYKIQVKGHIPVGKDELVKIVETVTGEDVEAVVE